MEIQKPTSAGNRPYQILLVEDSAADVRLVRLALRDHHIDNVLHVARDGGEAISFLENIDRSAHSPALDLLLLDMRLPKYNGEEILRRLRSTEFYAQTPVIIMTASDAPEDHERAQKYAALFYFRKPSRADEFIQLGAIVRELLTGRKSAANGGAAAERKGEKA